MLDTALLGLRRQEPPPPLNYVDVGILRRSVLAVARERRDAIGALGVRTETEQAKYDSFASLADSLERENF